MNQDQPFAKRSAYYAQGSSWAEEIQGGIRRSRRVAWWVAGAATVVAVLEAVALILLIPLKSVQPYTILVDRQTGYVQTAQGLEPGRLSQDAAVTQSFLVQYVLARETFDRADIKDAYRKVALWSAGAARDDYQRSLSDSNPNNPFRLYPAPTILKTTVKSVSLIDAHNALVRFGVERWDGGSSVAASRPFVAVVTFRYMGTPLRVEDRFLNPLGFQVTHYRRDAETADPGPATPRLQP